MIVIIILICLFVFFLFNFFLSAALPSKIFNAVILSPMRVSSVILRKTTGFFEVFIHIKTLKNENSQLRLNNQLLVAENIKLKEVSVENDFLRKALNLEKKYGYDLIPARIIGRDAVVFSNSVVIDGGENYGIKKEMAVISSDGVFFGLIKTVNSTFSQVTPITASGESINVITQESRVDGILRGEYGTSVVLELIPQDETIEIGEAIITSGINDKIPRGILAGYVQNVQSEPNNPFQKAQIKTNISSNRGEWVYVVNVF